MQVFITKFLPKNPYLLHNSSKHLNQANLKTTILRSFTLLLLIFSFIVSGCKKEEDLVGLDVQPEGNRLNSSFTDTITVIAFTQWDDSITTNRFDGNLLGSIYDPYFGITTASFYTQVRLSSDDVRFGNDTDPGIADSLVFSLAYKGIYGDSLSECNFSVFEVTEKMYPDSAYYSYQKLSVSGTPLARISFVPNVKDSIEIDSVKYPPLLRIKINDQSFINRIIAASGQMELSDNDNFTNFIKGFYFTSNMKYKGGSIVYFNLESSLTKLTLYYHTASKDSQTYSFVINDKTARYNHFEHYNYYHASQDLKKQIIQKDTTGGLNKLFLQAMAGLKVKIYFPFLSDLNANSKIAVNEAALLMYKSDDATDNLPPSITGVFKLGENGEMLTLAADAALGNNYYGGYYTNGSYKFRITNYIQSILDGKETQRGLALIVDKRRTTGNCIILNGTGAGFGTKRMRLAVKYTVIQ